MGNKKIFHTGDWKIDEKPNIGSYTDSEKFIDTFSNRFRKNQSLLQIFF